MEKLLGPLYQRFLDKDNLSDDDYESSEEETEEGEEMELEEEEVALEENSPTIEEQGVEIDDLPALLKLFEPEKLDETNFLIGAKDAKHIILKKIEVASE